MNGVNARPIASTYSNAEAAVREENLQRLFIMEVQRHRDEIESFRNESSISITPSAVPGESSQGMSEQLDWAPIHASRIPSCIFPTTILHGRAIKGCSSVLESMFSFGGQT